MNGRYTNERNIQMVIALMKAHNIHKVVASRNDEHHFCGKYSGRSFF